jgi:hypothetical protein
VYQVTPTPASWASSSRRTSTATCASPPAGCLKRELSIFRDGKQLAFLDGDQPEVIEGGDEEVAGRLIQLTYAALKPWHEDNAAPGSFDDGRVDLLHVACGYLGLEPKVSDVSGPVLGAVTRLGP